MRTPSAGIGRTVTRSPRQPFIALVLGLALALGACSASAAGGTAGPTGDTVYFGVSGPLTGVNAEYGSYWKRGFELALPVINDGGGINGKKLALKWEDSQADPKQTVPIAQKFVADNDIIAELGDFSSPASMAASSVYQKAGLVQYGFTNSSPNFTKGGEYMWSPSLTTDYYQKNNANVVSKYAKKVAVLYLQTDWGQTSFDQFSAVAAEKGVSISYSSPIDPASTDFRPVLIKAQESAPDAVVHIGYGPDGGLLVKQLRSIGFTKPFFGGQITPQFLQIAGKAAEGDIIVDNFVASDPSERVQTFVKAFTAKYGEQPGAFDVYAYDALIALATAARNGGATRAGVLKGLQETKNFPSVQFGEFGFDSNRRPAAVPLKQIKVVNGQFTVVGTAAG